MTIPAFIWTGFHLLRLGALNGLPGFPRRLQYGFWANEVELMDITPVTLDPDGIALTQTPGAAGNLTLAGALVTSGVAYFDVARCVTITSNGADTGKTFTVTGTDDDGNTIHETITGPGTTTVSGKKAFKTVSQIAVSAATAGAITAGSGDKFGFPIAIDVVSRLRLVSWAAALARDAGTFVAADANTATATTGDVRGTYTPSSASNGTRRLVITASLPKSKTKTDWLGVAQF